MGRQDRPCATAPRAFALRALQKCPTKQKKTLVEHHAVRLAGDHRRNMIAFHEPAFVSTMQIDVFQEDRKALLALFSMADDSSAQISAYCALGEVLVARDEGEIVGQLQVLETDGRHVFEIKSLAVAESRRGEGIGTRLIEAAVRRCRQRNARRLIVATATADIGNLRFYQRRGFRMSHIVRDAFNPSRGYADGATIDGISLRDQVFLDLDFDDLA